MVPDPPGMQRVTAHASRAVPIWLFALWLPVHGTLGFVFSPKLWKHAVMPFAFAALFSFVLFVILLEYALQPQEEYLVSLGWAAWASWPVAFLFVLAEDGLACIIVFETLFTFVATYMTAEVLCDRGVVARLQREHGVPEQHLFEHRMHGIPGMPDLGCMRSIMNATCFLALRLPLYLVSLPFAFACPQAAPLILPLLDGWAFTWSLLTDFLPLIGRVHCGAQAKFVETHFPAFLCFGFSSMLLRLMPGIGMLFFFGSGYGIALLFERFLEDEEGLTFNFGDGLSEPFLLSNETTDVKQKVEPQRT